MKTKIFFTAVYLLLVTFAYAQNNKTEKAKVQAVQVEKSIQSGKYEIKANQANPMSGRVWHLTSDYSVRISGDSTYVYLPYFGRAYSAPYNGEGGIKIENLMDSYKVDSKKEKEFSINFNAKGTNDTYLFSIKVWTNGNASINVTCNNRQAISYFGKLKMPDE